MKKDDFYVTHNQTDWLGVETKLPTKLWIERKNVQVIGNIAKTKNFRVPAFLSVREDRQGSEIVAQLAADKMFLITAHEGSWIHITPHDPVVLWMPKETKTENAQEGNN